MAAGTEVMKQSLQAAKWSGGKMVGRLWEDAKAAWGNVTADSATRYAKGIGLHAAAGAVVGGSYAGYKGEDVVQGAWRGAKTGAMVGLGASAYRNRGFLAGPGRFGISEYRGAMKSAAAAVNLPRPSLDEVINMRGALNQKVNPVEQARRAASAARKQTFGYGPSPFGG